MLVSLNEPPSQKLCSETPPCSGQPSFRRLWEEWSRTGAGVHSLSFGQRGSALWCVTWTEWHPVWSDSQQEVQWTAFMAHWTAMLFLNLHTRGFWCVLFHLCALMNILYDQLQQVTLQIAADQWTSVLCAARCKLTDDTRLWWSCIERFIVPINYWQTFLWTQTRVHSDSLDADTLCPW